MDRVEGEALDASVTTPARLTVYDATLDADSITAAMRENLDDELTEVKSENAIDRLTAQSSPRTLERVPAGARFRVRMILDILCPEDKELIARLIEGMRLLEDDALGGGGSRGSGRVRFSHLKLMWRSKEFYRGSAEAKEVANVEDLSGLSAGTVAEQLD
jgi:CRISPR-associated protein Csm3